MPKLLARLLDAAEDGNLAAVKECLHKGVDVNGRGRGVVYSGVHNVSPSKVLAVTRCKGTNSLQLLHCSNGVTTALTCCRTAPLLCCVQQQIIT